MKELSRLINEASEFGTKVAAEKGLTVTYEETPTSEQAKLAALHGREDAAACFFLLTKVLERQIILRRWVYFIVFLLLVVIGNQR